ncbi:hypothetical protein X943_000103 [Babesia divergens]|uniref:Uncharacterized protein n=1 Tax=Babesia divergens TaxID=32595 RepID=A0AAD9GKW1_BABDI|nr:hypothetical protein X943_000103 [Babesia divergens]
MNLRRLVEHVESLIERRHVRFSKPPLSQDTRRDAPSRFSKGGLRNVGEWISTCAFIDRVISLQKVDHDQFYTSDTGHRFVRALESRVCSLPASQLFQAPVESIVLRELRHQLRDLGTVELLRLPFLLKTADPSFRHDLLQVLCECHVKDMYRK